MSTRSLLVSVGLVVVMLGLLSFLQKQVPGTERMAKESKRITDLPVRESDRINLKGVKGSLFFGKRGRGSGCWKSRFKEQRMGRRWEDYFRRFSLWKACKPYRLEKGGGDVAEFRLRATDANVGDRDEGGRL